jgi:hypothetical protein
MCQECIRIEEQDEKEKISAKLTNRIVEFVENTDLLTLKMIGEFLFGGSDKDIVDLKNKLMNREIYLLSLLCSCLLCKCREQRNLTKGECNEQV